MKPYPYLLLELFNPKYQDALINMGLLPSGRTMVNIGKKTFDNQSELTIKEFLKRGDSIIKKGEEGQYALISPKMNMAIVVDVGDMDMSILRIITKYEAKKDNPHFRLWFKGVRKIDVDKGKLIKDISKNEEV